MTALNFQTPVANRVAPLTAESTGKWSRTAVGRSLSSLTYRLAQEVHLAETHLIDEIRASVEAQGLVLPRLWLNSYYVALKTNPFIILSGPSTQVHLAVVRGVAESFIGPNNTNQFLQIAGAVSWPQGTGEGSYYQAVLERFESVRLLELFQEASQPQNRSKSYFVYLDGLYAEEINYFCSALLQLTPEGDRRLVLPGLPVHKQPIIPPNVYITASLHPSVEHRRLNKQVLRHATSIDLSDYYLLEAQSPRQARPFPPVGYQRMMLAASLYDVDAARCKLASVLGDEHVNQLRVSLPLARILWRAGIVLGSRMLRDATRYIANSFDTEGQGLFDAYDASHNAQIALELHTIQRISWQLQQSSAASLQEELATYRKQLLT